MEKPLVNKQSFPLNISKYYSDVNGTLYDKVLLPLNLKSDLPFYLFSKFDLEGGYFIAAQNVPAKGAWVYAFTYIHGVGLPFLAFTGLNTVQNKIKIGDIINVFTDSIDSPNYYAYIVQHNEEGSIASIIKDSTVKPLLIDSFNYSVDSLAQFDQSFFLISNDKIGRFKYNQVEPRIFFTPQTYQTLLVTMRLKFEVNPHFLIAGYMLFSSDNLILNFNLILNG